MFKKHLILIIILLISGFLRFYNLMWDYPSFFNPDEKNMAIAITKLKLPNKITDFPSCFKPTTHNSQPITCNLNPHFFAYGQFPLYLAFFSAKLLDNPTTSEDIFVRGIFWLRFWSALSSTITVLVVYLITKVLIKQKKGLTHLSLGHFTAICAAFTPSLIQSAHFGTTESLLTFFFISLIYLSILLLSNQILNSRLLMLNSIILGFSLSTKVSALVYFAIPFFTILVLKEKITRKIVYFCLLFTFSLLAFIITSPFNFISNEEFKGSMNYESDVAFGEARVFYTRQFKNTTPVFFQIQKIFPYALGSPLFILGSLGFLLITYEILLSLINRFKRRSKNKTSITILWISFLVYFIPTSFLYAKWTRFIVPIFPLFSIFSTYFLYKFQLPITKYQIPLSGRIWNLIIGILVISSIIPGLAFFSIYTREDVRVTASKWIYKNIPQGSYVLSETANVVDIPLFSPKLNKEPLTPYPISFNFYELNEIPGRFNELLNHLEKANYIFIPSRRIFKNHMRFPYKYPLASKYYQLLFSGKLGFEKIAEFNSYPALSLPLTTYHLFSRRSLDEGGQLKFPDEDAEETFTVFDHPVIRIYKKKTPYTNNQYRNLFNNI